MKMYFLSLTVYTFRSKLKCVIVYISLNLLMEAYVTNCMYFIC